MGEKIRVANLEAGDAYEAERIALNEKASAAIAKLESEIEQLTAANVDMQQRFERGLREQQHAEATLEQLSRSNSSSVIHDTINQYTSMVRTLQTRPPACLGATPLCLTARLTGCSVARRCLRLS